jgi:hypothetical protein
MKRCTDLTGRHEQSQGSSSGQFGAHVPRAQRDDVVFHDQDAQRLRLDSALHTAQIGARAPGWRSACLPRPEPWSTSALRVRAGAIHRAMTRDGETSPVPDAASLATDGFTPASLLSSPKSASLGTRAPPTCVAKR